MKTEKAKFKFSEELQNDLLNGATIVWRLFHHSNGFGLILVRLAKGYFEEARSNAGTIEKFEYKIYKQDTFDPIMGEMYHASSHNDTLRGAKKRAEKEYYEGCYYANKFSK